MYYVVQTGDLTSSSVKERRDWSIELLASATPLGRKLFEKQNASICERGLRAAIYDHRTSYALRQARMTSRPTIEDLVKNQLEPSDLEKSSVILSGVRDAIITANLDRLQNLLGSVNSQGQIRDAFLQALVKYAVFSNGKQLLFFLFKHFSVDFLREDQETYHSALTLALFEDRNNVVTWLLDLGVDRKLFGSQHMFARIVCNSSWTMTNTFVQTCKTYWGNAVLKRLVNENAPPVQEKAIPPPLFLSILAGNEGPFEVLLRCDADVNQQWKNWTPLLLTIARGLPHFTVQLIEKGAEVKVCTSNESKMTIAHVLADATSTDSANQDQLLWDLFDRAPLDRSGSHLTPSQARRYTDRLLFAILKDAGVSFTAENGTGSSPVEIAISSGKLWIVDLIEGLLEASGKTDVSRLIDLPDMDGRTLLSYAIEDGDYDEAEELIKHGYDIDGKDIIGKTVLHEAAEHRKLDNLLFCLHHKANCLQEDILGRTALTLGVQSGDPKICQAIVHHAGSRIFLQKTKARETFLRVALKAKQFRIIPALLSLYGRTHDKNKLPTLSEFVGDVDVSGRTCLHDACIVGPSKQDTPMESTLNELIKLSKNLAPKDCVGDTPLHDSTDNSNSLDACLRLSRILLGAGADVNAANELGNTPLHHAYRRPGEKKQLVDLLLKNGANTTTKNKFGYTAEEWCNAVQQGDEDAKKADQEYKRLYDQQSSWKAIQEGMLKEKRENEACCNEQRLRFLQSYQGGDNQIRNLGQTGLALRTNN